jgi:hypothetical protein
MRVSNRLTALKVGKLDKLGRYADGNGLYLQVSRARTKAWVFRFMLNGRSREMGLGSIDIVSLADARERARQARKLLLDGSDPITARREARLRARAPLWTTKTETATRVRQRIEAILDWAKVRGYRDGENPARWRGHLEKLLPSRNKVAPVVHLAAMPHADVPALFTRLKDREAVSAKALGVHDINRRTQRRGPVSNLS